MFLFFFFFFFFFNDTATTEIYTLSLHDALPILVTPPFIHLPLIWPAGWELGIAEDQDRKSTRLNSSHSQISYAVFCLKKKKKKKTKSKKIKKKNKKKKNKKNKESK